MRITVEHTTRYLYPHAATYSLQSLRLTPASFEAQKVVSWTVDVRPGGEMLASSDGFGNTVHLASIACDHTGIEISAGGIVDVTDAHGVVAGAPDPVPLRVYLRRTALTEPTPEIRAIAEGAAGRDRIARLHALMHRIRDRVEYVAGVTAPETTAGEALADGKGVCQDHAHIFMAAARHSCIPTRYVTGYLLLETGGEAAAHHAWAEAWVDGLGWVGFDAANRICPTDRYVRLAIGLDAGYAAPIRGTRRGGSGQEMLEVAVRVVQARAGQQ